jgi:hypothetical protein
MYRAFPGSDYYGSSVVLGLASGRQSRCYNDGTYSTGRCHVRCVRTRFAAEPSPEGACGNRGYQLPLAIASQLQCLPASPLQICCGGCGSPPGQTVVRFSLTMRTGLAERSHTYLLTLPLSCHALVLSEFPRKVRHCPRSHMLPTSPVFHGNSIIASNGAQPPSIHCYAGIPH